jgi:predicted metalloprotease
MRWQRRGPSENLEDRRAEGGRGRIPLPIGRGGLGIGGTVALIAVMWMLGIDPTVLLSGDPGSMVNVDTGPSAPFESSPEEDDLVQFVSFVLDDLQTTWPQLLTGYRNARLVLFRGATHSACGTGQSEMGPFYCPADGKVYVDLSFYGELRSRFGAPGDFAQAYVLAHEVGHHVQALTGIEQRVRAEQRAAGGSANDLSVRMELQADCFAGVWGHHAARRDVLEPGDVEEGLRAAGAIGDDRIQEMSGRGVHPESFTHGSSDQRMTWLKRGLESGDPEVCDTFATKGG